MHMAPALTFALAYPGFLDTPLSCGVVIRAVPHRLNYNIVDIQSHLLQGKTIFLQMINYDLCSPSLVMFTLQIWG